MQVACFDYVHIGFDSLDNNFNPGDERSVKTIVYDLDDASDFFKDKVGRNTGYVINPEECLADNFSICTLRIGKGIT